MLEFISNLWGSLPSLMTVLAWLGNFILGIIIVRGIIASEITTWLKDHGFIKKKDKGIIYRSLDVIYDFVVKVSRLIIPERVRAILNHYKTGHPSESVLGCGQGDCRIFA